MAWNPPPNKRIPKDAQTIPADFHKEYAYDGDGNLEYEGWARPGTATSDAGWRVTKYAWTAGKKTSERVADRGAFTQVWDDRASLDYA
jgi:YD repeat-containing protein